MDKQKTIPPLSQKITRKLASESADHNHVMNFYSQISRDETGAPKKWKMSNPIQITDQMTAMNNSCSVASRDSSTERKAKPANKSLSSLKRRSSSRDSPDRSSPRESTQDSKDKISKENKGRRSVSAEGTSKAVNTVENGVKAESESVKRKRRPKSLDLSSKSLANGDDDNFRSPHPLTPCNVAVKRRKGRPKETPPTLTAESPVEPVDDVVVNDSSVATDVEMKEKVEENITEIQPKRKGRKPKPKKVVAKNLAKSFGKKKFERGVKTLSGVKTLGSKIIKKRLFKGFKKLPNLTSVQTDTNVTTGGVSETEEKDSDIVSPRRKPGRPPGAKNKLKSPSPEIVTPTVSLVSSSVSSLTPSVSPEKKKIGRPPGSRNKSIIGSLPKKKKRLKIDDEKVENQKAENQKLEKQKEDSHQVENEKQEIQKLVSTPNLAESSEVSDKMKAAESIVDTIVNASEMPSETVTSNVEPMETSDSIESATVSSSIEDAINSVILKANEKKEINLEVKKPSSLRTANFKEKKGVKSLGKLKTDNINAQRVKKKRVLSHSQNNDIMSTLSHLPSNDLRRKLQKKLIEKLNGKRPKSGISAISSETKELSETEVNEETRNLGSDDSSIVVPKEDVKCSESNDNATEKEEITETTANQTFIDKDMTEDIQSLSALVEQKRVAKTDPETAATEQKKKGGRPRKSVSEQRELSKFSDSESVCSEISTQSLGSLRMSREKQILVLGEDNTDSDDTLVRTRQRFEIIPGKKRKRTLSGEFDLLDEKELKKLRKQVQQGDEASADESDGTPDDDIKFIAKKKSPVKLSPKIKLKKDLLMAKKLNRPYSVYKAKLLKQSPFLGKARRRGKIGFRNRFMSNSVSDSELGAYGVDRSENEKVESKAVEVKKDAVEQSVKTEIVDSQQKSESHSQLSETAGGQLCELAAEDKLSDLKEDKVSELVGCKLAEQTDMKIIKSSDTIICDKEEDELSKVVIDKSEVDQVLSNTVVSNEVKLSELCSDDNEISEKVDKEKELLNINEDQKVVESKCDEIIVTENVVDSMEGVESNLVDAKEIISESFDSESFAREIVSNLIDTVVVEKEQDKSVPLDVNLVDPLPVDKEASASEDTPDMASSETAAMIQSTNQTLNESRVSNSDGIMPTPSGRGGRPRGRRGRRPYKHLRGSRGGVSRDGASATVNVEKKIREKKVNKESPELGGVTRKIELRQKISRSPLDNIALKQSIEENEYYKNEAQKAVRKELKKAKRYPLVVENVPMSVENVALTVPVENVATLVEDEVVNESIELPVETDDQDSQTSGEETESQTQSLLNECKSCTVVLTDFIKQLQLAGRKVTSEDETENDTEGSISDMDHVMDASPQPIPGDPENEQVETEASKDENINNDTVPQANISADESAKISVENDNMERDIHIESDKQNVEETILKVSQGEFSSSAGITELNAVEQTDSISPVNQTDSISPVNQKDSISPVNQTDSISPVKQTESITENKAGKVQSKPKTKVAASPPFTVKPKSTSTSFIQCSASPASTVVTIASPITKPRRNARKSIQSGAGRGRKPQTQTVIIPEREKPESQTARKTVPPLKIRLKEGPRSRRKTYMVETIIDDQANFKVVKKRSKGKAGSKSDSDKDKMPKDRHRKRKIKIPLSQVPFEPKNKNYLTTPTKAAIQSLKKTLKPTDSYEANFLQFIQKNETSSEQTTMPSMYSNISTKGKPLHQLFEGPAYKVDTDGSLTVTASSLTETTTSTNTDKVALLPYTDIVNEDVSNMKAVKKDSNEIQFVCSYCDKIVFREKDYIIRHIKEAHVGEPIMYKELPYVISDNHIEYVNEKDKQPVSENIFERMNDLYPSDMSKGDKKVPDKTSAEADSTTELDNQQLLALKKPESADGDSMVNDSLCDADDEDSGSLNLKIVDVVSLKDQVGLLDHDDEVAPPQPSPKIPTPVAPQDLMGKMTELKIPHYPRTNAGLSFQQQIAHEKKLFEMTKKLSPQTSVHQEPAVKTSTASSGKVSNTFKCEKCNVHAPLLAAMVAHLRNTHKEIPRLFQCPYCRDMEAESEAKIHQHIRKNHPTDNPNPPVALSEPAKRNLRTIQVYLPDTIKLSDSNALEKDIYMCLKCKKHKPSLETIYDHLEVEHSDVFVYVCPFCKTFKSKKEEVVDNHLVHVHQQVYGDVSLSLAIDGNQFTRVSCLIKEKNKSHKSSSSSSHHSKSHPHSSASGHSPYTATQTARSVSAQPPVSSLYQRLLQPAPTSMFTSSQPLLLAPSASNILSMPLSQSSANFLGMPVTQSIKNFMSMAVPQPNSNLLGMAVAPQSNLFGLPVPKSNSSYLGVPVSKSNTNFLGVPLSQSNTNFLGMPVAQSSSNHLGVSLTQSSSYNLGVSVTQSNSYHSGVQSSFTPLSIAVSPSSSSPLSIALSRSSSTPLGIAVSQSSSSNFGVSVTPASTILTSSGVSQSSTSSTSVNVLPKTSTQPSSKPSPPIKPVGATKRKKNLLESIQQLTMQKQMEQQGLTKSSSKTTTPATSPTSSSNSESSSASVVSSLPPPLIRGPPPLIRFDQLGKAPPSYSVAMASLTTKTSISNPVQSSQSSGGSKGPSQLPPRQILSSLFDTSDPDVFKPVKRGPVLNVPVLSRKKFSPGQASKSPSPHAQASASGSAPLDLSKTTPSPSPQPQNLQSPPPSPAPNKVTPEGVNPDLFKVFNLKPSLNQPQLRPAAPLMAASVSHLGAAQHIMPQQVRPNTNSTLAYRPVVPHVNTATSVPQIINMGTVIGNMFVPLTSLPQGFQAIQGMGPFQGVPTQLVQMSLPQPIVSQPLSVSLAVTSPMSVSNKQSVKPQQPSQPLSDFKLPTFKCPYCPKVIRLTLAEVQPHIETHHPGSSIVFTQLENK